MRAYNNFRRMVMKWYENAYIIGSIALIISVVIPICMVIFDVR